MKNFKILLIPAKQQASDLLFKNGETLSTISEEAISSVTIANIEAILFANGDREKDLSNFDQICIGYHSELRINHPELLHAVKGYVD